MDVVAAVKARGDENLKDKFRSATACVRRTIELYGTEGVAFSFNGGKDSTVLLHLLRASLAQLGLLDAPGAANGLAGVCTFIFEREDDFPEILQFVRETDAAHRLGVEELRGDFKSGLTGLLARRPVRAVLIGTRRGDPNAADQNMFCPSSEGWPPFMRVNPVLEWTYADVWAFLAAARAPYCRLYDAGYTSLGSTATTAPNSSLRKADGSYAPARALADGRLERAGRASRETPRSGGTSAFTRSAAVVLIGDELLSGKVEEQNAHFLARELFALGWRLAKVVTIPDDVGTIAAEVHAASEAHDLVITTGGVGPTVDDVTMAGVARALGYCVTRDVSLEQRLRGYFGEHVTDAHLKMAEVPTGEVWLLEEGGEGGGATPFPVVCCRNIRVLPGVPPLLRQKWKVLRRHLEAGGGLPQFRSVQLRLGTADETCVAPALRAVAAELGGAVSLGSYPVEGQSDGAGIVLSLESKDAVALAHARAQLLARLAGVRLVGEEADCAQLSKGE